MCNFAQHFVLRAAALVAKKADIRVMRDKP